MKLICIGCKLSPDEIQEYVEMAEDNEGFSNCKTPDDAVLFNEGTYNKDNGHFLCTTCYIKAGMPSRPYPFQWVAL